MPESASKSAGTCAAIFGHVAGDLVHAGGVAVAGRDDRDLVDVARAAPPAPRTISGMPVISLSTTAAWLYSWNASAFTFMARASASPFLKMMSASASPCARIGAARAFGFDRQPLLLGVGQRLDALPLDLGLLQHGGDQLLLAAQDLGFLHLDLLLAARSAAPSPLRRRPAAA